MNILLILISLLILGIIAWLLLSGKEEEAALREKEDQHLPDRALRRRASDKQIEEEAHEKRRKTDRPAVSDEELTDEEFKLPYLTDEIIPESSRFRVYRRTLLNSEVYAKKGYYDTSINLYEGVASRINDIKTKEKIEKNIEYLNRYMKRKEEAKSRTGRDPSPESVTSGDLKFTVDGNKQKRINIEVFDDVTRQSIQEMEARLRRELKDDLEEIKSNQDRTQETGEDGGFGRIAGEISDLKDSFKQLNRERFKLEEELENLRSPDTGPVRDREISDIKEHLEGLQERLDRREYDYLDVEGKAKQSDLDDLTDELENIKEIVESLKEEKPPDEQRHEYDKSDKKFHHLDQHIESLNRKLEGLPPGEPSSREPVPVILDPQPFVDLFNKMDESRRQPPPISPSGKHPDDDRGIEQAASGMRDYGDSGLPYGPGTPVKPEVSEKAEDKTSITREKEEDDLNEFDLLQDITKPKAEGELSDEEIFEKILRDDKKSRKEDEDSFEIMGDRKQEEGQYDVFNKEEEKKRREEEKFYRNFVKTDRKLKKELPILKVNFDFSKLPERMHLSREQNILEYSFYKYKPMLEKAGELIKKRRVREAIDYYKVVMSQNIPPEFKIMIRKNINDLTEYLEKYLSSD